MNSDYGLYTFVTSMAILVLQLHQMGRPGILSDRMQTTPGHSDVVEVPISTHAGRSDRMIIEVDGVRVYADGDIPHPSYIPVAPPGSQQPEINMMAELDKLRIAANTQRATLTAANRMPPETQVSRIIAEQTRRYMAEDVVNSPRSSHPVPPAPPAPKPLPVCTIGAPGLGAMPTHRPEVQSRTSGLASQAQLPTYLKAKYGSQVGIVLGVGRGEFVKSLLRDWTGSFLYLVDPYIHMWRGYDDPANVDDKTHQLIYEQLRSDLVPYNGKFTFIRDFSFECMSFRYPSIPSRVVAKTYSAAANQPQPAFVFVDANPSHTAAKRDINAWWDSLARGGMMAGTQYTDGRPDGVKRAVEEFAEEKHLTVYTVVGDTPADTVWYVIKN